MWVKIEVMNKTIIFRLFPEEGGDLPIASSSGTTDRTGEGNSQEAQSYEEKLNSLFDTALDGLQMQSTSAISECTQVMFTKYLPVFN
jgi:hypothetical protein